MSEDNDELTASERAYICKLWRLRDRTSRDRAFKRAVTITSAITVTAIALSSVAAGSEWPAGILWLLGFAVGSFYSMVVVNLKGWRIWSTTARVIDWSRVEEIATADKI